MKPKEAGLILLLKRRMEYFDSYEGKKPVPLPPGNVVYADGFTKIWRNMIGEEEEEELCMDLIRFLKKPK